MTTSPTTTTASSDSTFTKTPPRLTRSFSAPTTTPNNPSSKKDPSWRAKLRARYEPSQPGKEKWRDATLSEKERWREWHKAKDRERSAGLTATYFTDFYRAKNGWAWWVGWLA